MQLRIGYLYASGMNLYGDRGNVLALVQRCRWRGIKVEVVERGLAACGSLDQFDVLFAGGGQDRDQISVSRDLQGDFGAAITDAIEDNAVVLTICGAFQLLGRYFKTEDGTTLPGIGVFDAWTEAGTRRFVGDIVVHAEHAGRQFNLVGFENHGGVTRLGPTARPFGSVKFGAGNNGSDGFEGAVYQNAFGTYLHGPLLPKNPEFADHLIRLALARRYGDDCELCELDDGLEQRAHAVVIERIRRRGRVESGVR